MTSKSWLLIPTLLTLVLNASSPVAADPKIRRHRLARGEKAPFAGVLLTDAALAKLITDADQALKLCKAAREKAEREHKAQVKANKATCEARLLELTLKLTSCQNDLKRREQIWSKALEKCSRPTPWYKSPVLGFVLGNVVASGLCVGVSRTK